MKKNYMKPNMMVVELNDKSLILCGSPETPEEPGGGEGDASSMFFDSDIE